MVVRFFVHPRRRIGIAALVLVLVVVSSGPTYAQFRRSAVGGIAVDTDGVLSNATVDAVGELRQARAKALEAIPDDLERVVGLRKVSLRRLEAAIRDQTAHGKPLSDAIKYLAGLQQIQYVFVFPEQQDIVLAGHGEGWRVDRRGNLVGRTTGRPVMLLDDFVVALRAVHAPIRSEITCSIDPTSEGLKRLKSYVGQLRTIGPSPADTIASIEQSLGPQTISIMGVPPTSHFARVMVAADYRMKRLAMDFELAPIKGLPSFLQMMTAGRRGMQNMLPRWWLAPDYQPLLRDAEGLAWQLRGAAVKCMTEEDFLAADGTRQHTGKANPLAQRWADNMTTKYEELAVADPIFGELRNCMELAVVAALIAKHDLTTKAGYSMPLLLNKDDVKAEEFPAPKTVESKASAIKKDRNWVISASGGVRLNPWLVVEKAEKADRLNGVRTKAIGKEDGDWRWE